MPIDIQTPHVEDGYDETAVENYVEEIVTRFAASPEY
jgi:hypothetical protein